MVLLNFWRYIICKILLLLTDFLFIDWLLFCRGSTMMHSIMDSLWQRRMTLKRFKGRPIRLWRFSLFFILICCSIIFLTLKMYLLIFLVPYKLSTEMITMVNAQEKQPFERIEVTRQQALEFFAENPFKVICCQEWISSVCWAILLIYRRMIIYVDRERLMLTVNCLGRRHEIEQNSLWTAGWNYKWVTRR